MRSSGDEHYDCAYRDAFRLLLGEKLGAGVSRTVYECTLNPALIVKVEDDSFGFQNAIEWEIWRAVEPDPAYSRWFAPCHHIGPSGIILIQSRVEPLARGRLPAKLPAFLGDHKAENYGLLGNRVVCCDYGLLNSLVGNASAALRKVQW